MTYKIICVVGARPNFMKIAPIMDQMSQMEGLTALLVHTGQHYDTAMKHAFFEQLGIPEPDVDLEVGSGTHAVQTAEVMKRFEPVLDEQKPDAVLVVGDVNSTIACSLVAVKKNIPVIHVEAGLRSYDRNMPEEINRVLTDQIASLLFTTERSAQANLEKEGIDTNKIHFVGNVMIDTLMKQMDKATPISETLKGHSNFAKLVKQQYALLTLHRPSNVDNKSVLTGLLTVLKEITETLPIIFPIHPRTKKQIESFGLQTLLDTENVLLLDPLGYHQLAGLMANAKLVLTDSGGIQEETTALGVPCITLRENTERPITVTHGTNTVVGTDAGKIMAAFLEIMANGGNVGKIPEYWDGRAAKRIVERTMTWLQQR